VSTVTVPRAVLEQALAALERYQVKRQDFDRFADEITALRAALPCTYKCEAWPECACAALAQQEQKPKLLQAEAELRRLHALNGELLGALNNIEVSTHDAMTAALARAAIAKAEAQP